MIFYHIVILALIQGLTEFLPVSSSGHLVLFHALSDPDGNIRSYDENLVLDVAVHVGTLLSVLLYFRQDVILMFTELYGTLTGKTKLSDNPLFLHVLVASLPVIIAGFLLHSFPIPILRTLEVMAWATLIFGGILWWADRFPATRTIETITWRDSILIGFSQALALIPGTSRSGITMISARFLGFSRTEAAHYSLLLSMVAISGAGLLSAKDIVEAENMALGMDAALAVGLAFLSGYAAIALMMAWLKRATFTPFAIYRVILGSVLLVMIYGWGF